MIIKQQKYNAAVYCRLSADDGQNGESGSIQTQRELITQYCKAQGFNVYDYYLDDGFSGTNFQRPSFERMLNDIDAGNVNVVITKDLSRFGRDYIQSGYYIERVFEVKNVRFIAIDDNIDTLKNNNEILMPLKNVLNDLYARDISRKTRSAFNAKAKSGQFIGSKAPFGYKKSPEDKHQLIIDEPAAEVVKKIFDLAEQGYGYNRIAKTMRAQEIPNPNQYFNQHNPGFYQAEYWKKPYDWHTTSVRVILNNIAYLGHIAFGKQRLLTINAKVKTKMPQEEWIITENTHEPMITQLQWDTVHDMLKTRRREDAFGEVHIFAGLLYCPDCGTAMSHHARKEKGREGGEYSCNRYKTHGKNYCQSHYIRYASLYEIVLDDIRKQAENAYRHEISYMGKLWEIDSRKAKAGREKAKKHLDSAAGRIDELERIIRNLYEDKALSRITAERFDSMMAGYETEQKALIENVNELRATLEQAEEEQFNVRQFIKYIREYTDIQELTAPILNQLIQRIEIGNAVKHPESGLRTQDIKIK